ncbi:MAG: outer membrane protein TolC [Flavobacteriaceae bacterium]|jgi:outer membrane protein TolC
MKKLLKTIFILTVTVFSFTVSKAQSNNIENTTDISLPPLQVVIDSVLTRNGMRKFRNQEIRVKESRLASERIYWTRNLNFVAETSYGNLNNFSTNADRTGSTSALSNTTQYNYGAGLSVKLPIFDLINRKNQINLAKYEVAGAKNMLQSQEDEIRQTVIKMYQDLLLKQKILKIKSKTLGDGKVNMQMVEKEFRNGTVPVAEYVRITSIASNVEVDYEFAKSEFITAKKLLEDMAGFTFYQ